MKKDQYITVLFLQKLKTSTRICIGCELGPGITGKEGKAEGEEEAVKPQRPLPQPGQFPASPPPMPMEGGVSLSSSPGFQPPLTGGSTEVSEDADGFALPGAGSERALEDQWGGPHTIPRDHSPKPWAT